LAYAAGDQGVTLIGSALAGSEVFNITFAVEGITFDYTSDLEQLMTDLSAVMSTQYEFTDARITVLNSDTVIDLPLGDPIVGQDSSGPLPPQCAMRVSLKTNTPGRSGRGGFFLPGLCKGGISTTTARFGSGTISTVATAISDFSNALQASGGALALNSRTLVRCDTVTSARIGDVVDTIRRRRDAMVESYSSISL
jgi:hypothetical protein